MQLLIEKSKRRLTLLDEQGQPAFACRIALGRVPIGHKRTEGDGRTPEGEYFICLKREAGKYGPNLGVSYPSARDARLAVQEGRFSPALLPLFEDAEREGRRPPWGTPLGGEIFIHGGGAAGDWTAGCIALEDKNMAKLFALCQVGDGITIIP